MTKIVNVGVESELYNAGITDDGYEFHAEQFLVIVEYSDGRRLRHVKSFPGCKTEYVNEEGYCGNVFHDIRLAALAKAERLAGRVRVALGTGLDINEEHWGYWYPVYGSSAYLDEVSMMTPRQRAGEDD